MIKYYCDGCGSQVTQDTGVIKMKEMTLEFPDKKISISVEVDKMRLPAMQLEDNPAVCASCIAKKFAQWSQSISNAPS